MNEQRASKIKTIVLFALLFVSVAGLTGCGSLEAENTSSKPWNSPEGWQNGAIPSQMLNGR